MKNILMATIIIIGLFVSNSIVIAIPVVEDVTINPMEPTPLSTVTITATITNGEGIDEVHLMIQECKSDVLCFFMENHTMNLVNGEYQYNYKLQHEDATLFKYNFVILSNGKWFITEETTDVYLKLDSGDSGNGGNDTPGFELILLLIAIFVGVFLLKRKRYR